MKVVRSSDKKREEQPAKLRREVNPILYCKHPATHEEMEIDFSKDVRIGKDIEEDLRELPSRISWFMSIRDVLADELREAEYQVYCIEEDLYIELLENSSKDTKVTDIKNYVKIHPKMRAAYAEKNATESRFKHAESVVAALFEKRWSLQSIAKLKTAEMGSGLGDA